MKISDTKIFCCPKCLGSLSLSAPPPSADEEIQSGVLTCLKCGSKHEIRNSIPRFVPRDNYAASFGYQWNAFARTQVGGEWTGISQHRFDVTTKWPHDLTDQTILEAGCGAGRFSLVALGTGAEVYSFDYSEAVEAAQANTRSSGQKRRHHLFQASIYEIPLPHEMFDKIFCLGVLQHCPDVKKAYLSLVPFLKPGGELVIDCYLSQPLKHMFNLKYLLRPFFKWWKPSYLYAFWSVVIAIAYDLKLLATKLPLFGSTLAKLIPIGPLSYEPEHHFTVAELKEIKTLSVIDMLSPKYDKCQNLSSFRAWMEEAGLEILELTTGYNGINARGRRPVLPGGTDDRVPRSRGSNHCPVKMATSPR
jgi:SAM-dependent methyltransferase